MEAEHASRNEEGWDGYGQADRDEAELMKYEDAHRPLEDDDALRYNSVSDVSKLLRSSYLSTMFKKLSDYEQQGDATKNAIVPEDPEYEYISDCSTLVLRLEVEKSRVMVFLRAHYSIRFPELAMFCSDSVLYARVVKLIGNNMDLTKVVEKLDELVPSQLLIVVIACASTSSGRDLTSSEMQRVMEACQELENLEMAKQTFLEYIQCSMPLICPNLCAFLGTATTSQIFAITGSVAKISIMDRSDLEQLGSRRAQEGGVALRTTGFLSNVDLVANLPPQLRPKALRLVAAEALTLARVDANRRASNRDEGIKSRRKVSLRMRTWLDPPVLRGAGHNTYERRGRKRSRVVA